MQKWGIEIVLLDGNVLLFDLLNFQQAEFIFNLLLNLKKTKAININLQKSHLKLKSVLVKNSITQKWLNYQISNFEYLMILNDLSSRSYKDLS